MLIKDLMSHPVISVSESTTVGEALETLNRQRIAHLPVVDLNQSLVGIVSKSDLLKVFPIGKDLSTFQTNLLSRTAVSKAMKPNPYTIQSDRLIEEAALIMRTEKIGSLPVTDDAGKLVGIITKNDIMDALMTSLGFGYPGTRITIAVNKKWGFLSEIISIADKHNLYIDNLVTFNDKVVLKVNDKAADFVKDLKKAGFNVTGDTYIDAEPQAKAE